LLANFSLYFSEYSSFWNALWVCHVRTYRSMGKKDVEIDHEVRLLRAIYFVFQIGRKLTAIIGVCGSLAGGYALIAGAQYVWMLLLGRFLHGVGIATVSLDQNRLSLE
jgi:MFS family permease